MLRTVYAETIDGMLANLNGCTRAEWEARTAADKAFWKQHPGVKSALEALGDLCRTQRAAVTIARARVPAGVRRLVLLQMESEDCEDHSPGEDEWVWTALSGEQLLDLAEDAYPYRYRGYDERCLFSEWLIREGLAEPAPGDHDIHVVY